jgi:hypothetical protein
MPKQDLPETPDVWYFQCKYCQQMREWGKDHESEILELSGKICEDPHFVDYVRSTLDTWDHAKATPQYQIMRISKIHDDMGCKCQDPLAALIDAELHGSPTEALISDIISSRSLDARSCDAPMIHSAQASQLSAKNFPTQRVPSEHQSPGHSSQIGQQPTTPSSSAHKDGQKGHSVPSPHLLAQRLRKIHSS